MDGEYARFMAAMGGAATSTKQNNPKNRQYGIKKEAVKQEAEGPERTPTGWAPGGASAWGSGNKTGAHNAVYNGPRPGGMLRPRGAAPPPRQGGIAMRPRGSAPPPRAGAVRVVRPQVNIKKEAQLETKPVIIAAAATSLPQIRKPVLFNPLAKQFKTIAGSAAHDASLPRSESGKLVPPPPPNRMGEVQAPGVVVPPPPEEGKPEHQQLVGNFKPRNLAFPERVVTGVNLFKRNGGVIPEGPQGPKKMKKFMRSAGGETWEDKTLNEWDKNDFRIFVGDLGNEVTDEMLVKAFSRYPSFKKAKIIIDSGSRKSKGYGFVALAEPDDYIKAMREMQGHYIGTRPCKLKKSTWQDRNIGEIKKRNKKRKEWGFKID